MGSSDWSTLAATFNTKCLKMEHQQHQQKKMR